MGDLGRVLRPELFVKLNDDPKTNLEKNTLRMDLSWSIVCGAVVEHEPRF